MTPDTLFQIANPVALTGWLMLAAAPLAPRVLLPLAGYVLPALLSLGYAALILVHWSSAPGGFDSLAGVMALFTDPGTALAGWVHFLAFDLFVGAWALRQARAEGLPHLVMLPVLGFTFMLGPIGLLLFFALRTGHGMLNSPRPETV